MFKKKFLAVLHTFTALFNSNFEKTLIKLMPRVHTWIPTLNEDYYFFFVNAKNIILGILHSFPK